MVYEYDVLDISKEYMMMSVSELEREKERILKEIYSKRSS